MLRIRSIIPKTLCLSSIDTHSFTQTRSKQLGVSINWVSDMKGRGGRQVLTHRQKQNPGANKNSRSQFGRIHRQILGGKRPVSDVPGMAFNSIPRKKHLMKPMYTIEEQIAYMHSKSYLKAYMGMEIWRFYKRQGMGQSVRQWHKPRLRCLDKFGILNINSACPVCKDEYLFFDYRNPLLIEQFLIPGSMQPMPILKVGLCIEQYIKLQVELLKAREHCTIDWGCEARIYDYKELYGNKYKLTKEDKEIYKLHYADPDEHRNISRGNSRVEFVHDHPLIAFDPHNKDINNWWDIYWKRHIKFAKGVQYSDPELAKWKPKDDEGVY